MKKLYALLSLLLVVCMLFAACGAAGGNKNGTNEKSFKNEKAALVGGTFSGGNGLFTRTYSFKADGTFTGTHTISLYGSTNTTENSGTYEILEDIIKLANADGSYSELPYTYNSDTGKIVLLFNGEVSLTK